MCNGVCIECSAKTTHLAIRRGCQRSLYYCSPVITVGFIVCIMPERYCIECYPLATVEEATSRLDALCRTYGDLVLDWICARDRMEWLEEQATNDIETLRRAGWAIVPSTALLVRRINIICYVWSRAIQLDLSTVATDIGPSERRECGSAERCEQWVIIQGRCRDETKL